MLNRSFLAINAILWFLLIGMSLTASAQSVVRIDSLPATGVLLDKGWKWHAGDNPAWAKPEFDDAEWEDINPALDIHDLPQVRKAQIGWFRLTLQADSTVADQPLALVLSQVGASEIYLNGKLLHHYGTMGSNGKIEQTSYLRDQPISLRLGRQPIQVLAVRYSFKASNFYVKLFNDNPCLRFVLQLTDDYDAGPVADRLLIRAQQWLLIGLFLLLGGFCLFLYFLFRTARFYLFLGLYCLGQFAQISCQFSVTAESSTTGASIIFTCSLFFSVLSVLAFLYGFYVLFQQPRRWFFYLIVGYAVLTIPILLWSYKWGGIFSSCFYLVLNLDTLRLSFQAARRRRPGAWVLFITALLFYLLFFAFVALSALDQARASYLTSFISLFVAPFGLSLFVAGEFARTSRSLQMRVVEVEALSEKTLAQEQEKQQILATQNQTLEKQVIERTAELNTKNEELVIEAALERVRSRSLAMQHSHELQEVITLVFQQLSQVNFAIDGAAFIGLYTENAREAVQWVVNPNHSLEATCFKLPYFDHPFLNANWEAVEKGADFITQSMTFDEKNRYFNQLFTHTDYRYLPEDRKRFMYEAESYSLTIAFEKHSSLILDSYSGKIYSEQDIGILKRFARVFDQAYTRFLDIQKAEAQAREAVRTASLDRVRAEIASMRTTQDLARISPLIWKELTILGVPFIRCGVFIMDEQLQQVHTFLSSPDGNAIASFTTPFANPGLLAEALPHWRTKQIYTTHWDEAAFLAQAQTLISQGVIASPEIYLTDQRPTSLYLHLLPFLQGMLYVGNDTAPLTDDQLSVVQTLADAFSTAYARYDDFTKLEAAKKLAESTLTELKVTQTQLIQREKMASLGELTAGIAHEIQNPLNFVNNFSEVSAELVNELKEEAQAGRTEEVLSISDDLVQNLQKITHHGGRASAIVKGMLEHSRTSTSERQATNLNALAEEYLRLAYQGQRVKYKEFHAELITDFTPELWLVAIAPQEIGRVLLNLYNNAFYAVRQKQVNNDKSYVPTVRVSTHQGVNNVEIRVRDNGIGIPDDIRQKIFQPFFTTKPTGEGTGLGLSLSYDIVTKGHGGTLTVESEPGQFTQFVITLPIT